MLTDPVSEAKEDALSESDMDSPSDFDESHEPDKGVLDRLQEAESKAAAEPENYDAHIQLIRLLSNLKLRQRLAAAREKLAARFPLSEALWLEWLADSLEGLETEADAAALLALAHRSLDDFLSVALLQKYLAIARLVDPEVVAGGEPGAAAFRRIAERALRTAGSHIMQGDALHAELCDFEAERVAEALASWDSGAEDPASVIGLPLQHARDAWARRLATPLQQGATNMEAYRAWESSLPSGLQRDVPAKLQKAHDAALAAYALREAFESSVDDDKPATPELLGAFVAYIAFEESQPGPAAAARARLLRERAVARFPVTTELWKGLCRSVEAACPPEEAEVAWRRACRSCPWSGTLWAGHLRALERAAVARDGYTGTWLAEHRETYSRAIGVGLADAEDYVEVMTARIAAVRRWALTAATGAAAAAAAGDAEEACSVFEDFFPDHAAGCLVLRGRAAQLHAAAGDVAAGRAAWRALLALPALRGRLDAHERYVAWEVQQGAVEAARGWYAEALGRKKGGLGAAARAALAAQHIAFEECHGSAAQEAEARRASAVAAAAAAAAEAAAAAAGAGGKRGAAAAATGPARKRAKGAEKAAGGAGSGGGRDVAPSLGPPVPGDSGARAAADPHKREYSDEHTVFVKHLHNDVTEADLKELFPAATGVRLLMKPGGLSKGCAYVDFATDAEVELAVQKDKQLYRGLHLLVARSDPEWARQQKQEKRGGRGGGPAALRGGRLRGRGGGSGRGAGRHHARIGADVAASADTMPRQAVSNTDFRAMLGL